MMKNILVTGGFGFIGFNALFDWTKRLPDCNFFNVDIETYAAKFKLCPQNRHVYHIHYISIKWIFKNHSE